MSMMLPDELEWVLEMLGYNWPTADEDKLKDSAKLWRKFGDEPMPLDEQGVAAERRNVYLQLIPINPLLLKEKGFKAEPVPKIEVAREYIHSSRNSDDESSSAISSRTSTGSSHWPRSRPTSSAMRSTWRALMWD